jgi:hypothetical protein
MSFYCLNFQLAESPSTSPHNNLREPVNPVQAMVGKSAYCGRRAIVIHYVLLHSGEHHDYAHRPL